VYCRWKDFGVVYHIKHEIKDSEITLLFRRINGHQDDTKIFKVMSKLIGMPKMHLATALRKGVERFLEIESS